MKYEIIKRDTTSETTIDQGECETYEDALEIYIDCIIDHGSDDSWLMEDYTRIKSGKNAMRYAKNMDWLRKNKTLSEQFITPTKGKPYEIELKVSGKEKE